MNRSLVVLALVLVTACAATAPQGPAAPAGNDLLILRGGETRVGLLKSCDAASCTLGATVYKFEDVAWIGFGTGDAKPPAITFNSDDQLSLRDGSEYRGHFMSATADKVEIEGGLFDRKNVSWVHLRRR